MRRTCWFWPSSTEEVFKRPAGHQSPCQPRRLSDRRQLAGLDLNGEVVLGKALLEHLEGLLGSVGRLEQLDVFGRNGAGISRD
jgi:hypothetical protein